MTDETAKAIRRSFGIAIRSGMLTLYSFLTYTVWEKGWHWLAVYSAFVTIQFLSEAIHDCIKNNQ